MSYYGGGSNYVRGDYYRGDPFIGGLVAGAVGRLAGRAARWVGGRIGKAGGVVGPIVRDAAPAAAAGAVGMAVGRMEQYGPGMGMMIPSLGPDKKPWPTNRDGTPRRARKDGKPYKRATLNPLNPRALRRALRRTEGFEQFAKRAVNSLYKVIDGRRVRTFKKKTPTS